MRIELRQLPEAQEVILKGSYQPEALELEMEGIKPSEPVEIKAAVTRFPEALDANISLEARISAQCGRCLNEFTFEIHKKFRLDYPLSRQDTFVDITDDVRQELMLQYPLPPLCSPECKGLCAHCGNNLNENSCSCNKS